MAKTKGPLLSLDAHGSLGRVLTYSHRKSGKQVRGYNKPLVAASAKQRGQRRLTEFLVAQWQNMSAGDKATWEANARLSGPNIAGYHYFLREAQRDLYTHTGLCGYWHCNEIVGGTVLDLSGNAIHGTLQPDYPANAPVLIDSYKTKFSKGLLYDGVDEYMGLGDNPILNPTTRISIELLIKPTVLDGTLRTILSLGFDFVGHQGLWLLMNAVNKVDCYIGDGADKARATGNAALSVDLYYTVSITWDGTTAKIHINNVTQDTTDLFGGPIDYKVENDQIGGRVDSFFGGLIDEVCIYNRYISDAERTARYRFAMRKVD